MVLATVLKALFIPIKTLQKAIKGFLVKVCQFSDLIDFFVNGSGGKPKAHSNFSFVIYANSVEVFRLLPILLTLPRGYFFILLVNVISKIIYPEKSLSVRMSVCLSVPSVPSRPVPEKKSLKQKILLNKVVRYTSRVTKNTQSCCGAV